MEQVCGDAVKNGSIVSVKTRKWYRYYVNNFSDENTLWSVDEGTQESERHCFKVICASDLPTSTYTDLKADSIKEPRAWVSVCGVLRELTDAKGRIVIVISKK